MALLSLLINKSSCLSVYGVTGENWTLFWSVCKFSGKTLLLNSLTWCQEHIKLPGRCKYTFPVLNCNFSSLKDIGGCMSLTIFSVILASGIFSE